MRSLLHWTWWALTVNAVFWLAPAPAQSAQYLLQVRDAHDGHFLAAEFAVAEIGAPPQWRPMSEPAYRAAVKPRQLECLDCPLNLSLRAPGYAVLTTTIGSDAQLLPAQFWLDPLPIQRSGAGLDTGVNDTLLDLYIYDLSTQRPASGVRAKLLNQSALSDQLGYVSLDLSDLDLSQQPVAASLQIYRGQRLLHSRELLLVGGKSTLIIDLGSAAIGPDHRQLTSQLQRLQSTVSTPIAHPVGPRAPIQAPPSSIRVGYADAGFTTPCCVGACNAVSVMSLETYVRRGLNDEWIASWTEDSLRSGALAYRSYGAWHVLHPRTASYDICSSACCQVNDSDTHSRTDAAVSSTLGLMLIDGPEPFRAEYSAENNAWDDPNDGLPCSNADLSCGNGFVGSPAADWPCMADLVATDRGCFGHGRGMSQWGTQRWSNDQGRRWPWIVNHYYNDNDNATGAGSGLRQSIISSPLRINSIASLASAMPGELISLAANLSNLASETHAAVYMGASLFRSGQGFIDDSANDLQISLPPGDHQRIRNFALPSNLVPGSYDVLVSLYLDVDGNQAINSGDLALTLERYNGALLVIDVPLYADGFEGL